MSAYADLGTLWINIAAKNTAGEELEKIRAKAANVGKSVEELGKKFTTYLTVPLAGLGALAIKEFASFEAAMSKVQATTQATSDEMTILTAKARELGKSTIYSAEDVAEAMNYMAMAGWDTTQIIDGLEGVLDLAAASGGDLATVSDIVTDALTAFGLSASDTTDFVDLLANVSRTANTNVEMLGESFKYVAPVSASLGISAEQTALALGLLANNGIKGSQAGTSLRSALNHLIKPTTAAANLMKEYGIAVQTADDGSVDLMATFASLKNGIADLEKTQQAQIVSTLVGTEAMSGVMAIINATEADIDKLTEATTNYSGSAKQMAETMNNNVKGNLNKLKSAFSELLIVVGENLVPMFTKLVEKATEVIEWFSSLDEGTQEFIVRMGLLSAAIGPVLTTLGKLTTAFTPVNAVMSTTGGTVTKTVIPALTGAGGLIPSLTSLVSCLTGPVGLALIGASAGFLALNNHAKETSVLSFEDTVKNIEGISSSTAEMVTSIQSDWSELENSTRRMMTNQSEITEEGLESLKNSYISHFEELIELEEANGSERLAWLQQKYEEAEGEQRNYYYRLLQEEEAALGESVSAHEENMSEVLQIMDDLAAGKITNVQEAMTRIQEIIDESSQSEIQNSIDKGEELLTIAQNFDALDESMRAERASQVIKDANTLRDEKIQAAQDAYEEEVRCILGLKTESKEKIQEMLADAENRKNEEIRIAHEQKMGIVDELGSAWPELSKIVNYETGEINSDWTQMWKSISSSHETEMQTLVKNAGKDLGDVMGYYNEYYDSLSERNTQQLNEFAEGHSSAAEQALKMAENVKSASETSATNLLKPIDKVETLHKKLEVLPTTKTVNVVINETTRQRTEVYGTTTVSSRSALALRSTEDGIAQIDSGLYNMTALNTGFSGDSTITRYEQNERVSTGSSMVSTKQIEDKLDNVVKALEDFGSLQIFLDKYTLVGELTPGISKELARGVRLR